MPDFQLAIVGAGPAGMGAAVAAAPHCSKILLLDESLQPGGQVYRAPALSIDNKNAMGPDHLTGEKLRELVRASNVECALGERLWFAAPGFRLSSAGERGIRSYKADAVVAATGTSERIVPVPGWTTPGVIGLAAATILLKAQQMLPGKMTVVAGRGPLIFAVAASILKGGGRVAAVVDQATLGEWLSAFPALAMRPDLLARGAGWLTKIKAAGVPIFFGHSIARVFGHEGVTGVAVISSSRHGSDRMAEKLFEADSLAMGHGLTPATELTRLLGAAHQFDRQSGGWYPVHDREGRTSVSKLLVAGDGSGIRGAAAAFMQGQIAGLRAVADLGLIGEKAFQVSAKPLYRKLRRAEIFGTRMADMMAFRRQQLDTIEPDTVVCRCEDITRTEIESAAAGGAASVNELKSFTRCGMGPCQGRMCGDVAAELVALNSSRDAVGQWTARVPIRPVPLSQLAGDYRYDDVRAAAPQPQPL